MKFVTGDLFFELFLTRLNELQRSDFEITVACANSHKIFLHFIFSNSV
jgi:hypothetical protein